MAAIAPKPAESPPASDDVTPPDVTSMTEGTPCAQHAAMFDGVARHTKEGYAFQKRAVMGFIVAGRFRGHLRLRIDDRIFRQNMTSARGHAGHNY